MKIKYVLALLLSLLSSGSIATSFDDYTKGIQDVCNSARGILGVECININMPTIKKLAEYCKAHSCSENNLTIEDYNSYAWDLKKKSMVKAYEDRKAGALEMTVEPRAFCNIYNSLLATKGLMRVIEAINVDKELPNYTNEKQKLLSSLEEAKSYWASNCI